MRVTGFAAVARRVEQCHVRDEAAQMLADAALALLDADVAVVERLRQQTVDVVCIEPPSHPLAARIAGAAPFPASARPTLHELVAERTSWRAHVVDQDGAPLPPGDPRGGDAVEQTILGQLHQSSSLGVAVVVNGQVWGEIIALRQRPVPFDDADRSTAEVIATLLGGALTRIDYEEQVFDHVEEDALTGLAGRRVADTVAENAVSTGAELCIVMCDVDGLKRVNDEFGHETGDELLRSVADVLRRVADQLPGTRAARMGGDEFCLVAPGWPRAQVEEVVAATVEAHPLPHGAAISYGVASSENAPGSSSRQLFRRADLAQYRAKRARARRRELALPPTADPGVTAERLLQRGLAAVSAEQGGALSRLCALAATATDVMGGGAWQVRRVRPGLPAIVVAAGGGPSTAPPGTPLEAQHGAWSVRVGVSADAPTGPVVRTALEAALIVAVRSAG